MSTRVRPAGAGSIETGSGTWPFRAMLLVRRPPALRRAGRPLRKSGPALRRAGQRPAGVGRRPGMRVSAARQGRVRGEFPPIAEARRAGTRG